MKKNLLLLAVFNFVLLTVSAQNYRLWATYYGGTDLDGGFNLITDAAGNVYLTGQTYSTTGIATAGSHQATYGGGGGDAYLVKFNGAGTRLWATYYGGDGSDYGYSIKVDASGNVYLAGYTSSTDSIATAGTYQPGFNGTTDAFLVKFNSAGVRLWGTYYGGPDFDQATAVTTDASGNVYMTGYTIGTTGFASAGAHQLTSGGMSDAFLVKFNSVGNRLWGTFYGGSDNDIANDVATDASGNVIIGGYTYSTDSIASAGGFQNTFGGSQDGFVAKFNSSGARQWATYYGGSELEFGNGIATDTSGSIYLAGITQSTDSIASGGFQNTFGGFMDAFLVKFNSAGNRLWGTYYGGTGIEEGNDVATNVWGDVFLGGDSYSDNIGNCIATPNGYQNSRFGSENHFVAVFNPNGVRLCGTYYGKVHEEEAHIAVNSYGDVYMAGWTYSTTGIASAGAFQTTFGGGSWDAFIVKFSAAVPHEPVIVPNDSLPPTPPVISTWPPPKKWYTIALYDGGGTTISNALLRNFSPGAPLPISGSSTISFTCDFSGTFTGSSSGPVSCPATVQMKVTYVYTSGATRVFDTEMLQLNLSGGTLPPGVQLRESPTLASIGQIVITDIGGGLFQMSSFFDVFTELSTNGGMSWQPNSNPPANMQLQDDVQTSIPTLSEWGLISLCILVLTIGIFYVRRIV